MATEMPSKEFLLEQIARAKRFAARLTSKDDQEKFEKIAADYQSQLEVIALVASTAAPGNTIGSRRAIK